MYLSANTVPASAGLVMNFVYKALREPIVRRFGEEFYRALEAAEEFLREQER